MKPPVSSTTVAWLCMSGAWRTLEHDRLRALPGGDEAVVLGEEIALQALAMGRAIENGARAEQELRASRYELLRVRRDMGDRIRELAAERARMERELRAAARDSSRVKGLLILEIEELRTRIELETELGNTRDRESEELRLRSNELASLVAEQSQLLQEICSGRVWRLRNWIHRVLGRRG